MDQDPTLSAAGMVRIAAALPCEPMGVDRWVIMTRTAPHIVGGVFPTRQRATEALRRLDPARGFSVFGPFVNSLPRPVLDTLGLPAPSAGGGCVHVCYSEYICEPAPEVLGRIRALLDAQTFRDTLTGGTVEGSQVDAVFFGPAAAGNFVYPHLLAVHGLSGTLNYLALRGMGHY